MTLVETSGVEIAHVRARLRDEGAKEVCAGLQGRALWVVRGGPCEGSDL